MILEDDRTPEQKKTHNLIWLGTDPFLSGCGLATGGPSYAGWACTHADARECEAWVRGRGDMKRVRLVLGNYRPRPGRGHVHIYVWGERD